MMAQISAQIGTQISAQIGTPSSTSFGPQFSAHATTPGFGAAAACAICSAAGTPFLMAVISG
jgi:hypothetical protein